MVEVATTSRLTGRVSGVSTRPVRLGKLSLHLVGPDARYLCLDGVEFVRRLFVAVRDARWGTAPSTLESLNVEDEPVVSCSATGRAVAAEDDIDLRWSTLLRCGPDGTTEFSFEATALRPFRYGRIGLCVLHPTSFAGGSYAANTPDGWVEGRLTTAVAPQPPGEHGFGEPLFPAFDQLVLTSPSGVRVSMELAGDLFEFEDQRNWADASYKTYSTPLRLGPQAAVAGQTFEQRVLIRPEVARRKGPHLARTAANVTIAAHVAGKVPALGLILGDDPVGAEARHKLTELRPAHLRVDLELDRLPWRARFSEAQELAGELDLPLELAITLSPDEAPLNELHELICLLKPALARVLVFRPAAAVTPAADASRVRQLLRQAGLSAPVYGGTDLSFAELNAQYPHAGELDGVAFPVVPTVHADDDLSLVETMPIFADIVRTAREHLGQVPVAVSPITLRARPAADPRQSSPLAGAWSLGTVAALAGAATSSITLFEACGPNGVVDASGGAHPVYHVLRELCAWRGRAVVATSIADPLATVCLAVDTGEERTLLLLGNVLDRPNNISIEGVEGRQITVRSLVGAADDRHLGGSKRTCIELDAHEVVRLEVRT